MKKDRQVIYEPHPVSAKRKAELLAAGYKVLDARFKPAGEPDAREDGKVPEAQERDLLIAELTEKGIAFDDSMGTDELRAVVVTTDDGLDDMEAEQLHALAKERDVKVHHNAGADKVREALREAASTSEGQ